MIKCFLLMELYITTALLIYDMDYKIVVLIIFL